MHLDHYLHFLYMEIHVTWLEALIFWHCELSQRIGGLTSLPTLSSVRWNCASRTRNIIFTTTTKKWFLDWFPLNEEPCGECMAQQYSCFTFVQYYNNTFTEEYQKVSLSSELDNTKTAQKQELHFCGYWKPVERICKFSALFGVIIPFIFCWTRKHIEFNCFFKDTSKGPFPIWKC